MTFDALHIDTLLKRYFKLDPKNATRVNTVADLTSLIIAQNPTIPSAACPTADAFYTLREKISQEFHLPIDELHLNTPTSILMGYQDPPVIWQRLAKLLDVPLPSLVYPRPIVTFFSRLTIVVTLGSLVVAVILKKDSLEQLVACPGVFILYIATAIALHRLLHPILAKHIPAHLETLGGLAYVLAVESKKAKGGPWTRADIMATVQLILGSYAGKNPREMRRHMRLEFE